MSENKDKPSWLAYVGVAGLLYLMFTMGKDMWADNTTVVDSNSTNINSEMLIQEKEQELYQHRSESIVRNAIRIAFMDIDTEIYYKMNPLTIQQIIERNIQENQIIMGMLVDGNIKPLGYLDDKGFYRSIFVYKKKE